MTDPDPLRLAALAARLAIPDRRPDESFVRRVALEVEARELARSAAHAGREQLVLEFLLAGALLLAAPQLAGVGARTAALVPTLPPLAPVLGWLVLAWVVGLLLFATICHCEARAA